MLFLMFCLVLFAIPSPSLAISFFTTVKVAATDPRPLVKYSALAVSTKDGQADAHLLAFPGNHRFLIDAGEGTKGTLLKELKAQGATSLEKIIVTHAHRDHYGGIYSLLEAKFPIGVVYFNMPSKVVCDTEVPWGCDWSDIAKLLKALSDKKIPVKASRTGDLHFNDGLISLETLYAYGCEDNPFGRDKIGVNDMSLIMRLDNGQTSVLFTGDLAPAVGGYLADHGVRMEADILKIPHHGAEDVAPNSFLNKVKAKVAIVPAPLALWNDPRVARVRSWLKSKNIPVYVSGVNGTTNFKIYPNEWVVVPYF